MHPTLALLDAYNKADHRTRECFLASLDLVSVAELSGLLGRLEELRARSRAVNWNLAPAWAKYHAIDGDGTAYWYASKPHYDTYTGRWHTDKHSSMQTSPYSIRDIAGSSLEERPQ